MRDVLIALTRVHPTAVVVPVGMRATLYLASVSASLPTRQVFPLAPEPLLRELDNKWSFAAVLQSLGIAHPVTRLLTTPADLDELDVPFPAMVKPLDAEGSRGVQRVDTSAALDEAVGRIESAGLLPVLVQERIEGSDLNLSGLAEHGRLRTFVAHRLLGDGSLEIVSAPDAVAYARTLVSATSFHGVFNIDLRRAAGTGSLLVLELNPRLYANVNKHAYAGVNVVELGVRLARGEDFAAHAARLEVIQDMSGRVRRLFTPRGRAELSAGSRCALRADLHDSVATLVRGLQRQYRRSATRHRHPWDRFDADRRRRQAGSR